MSEHTSRRAFIAATAASVAWVFTGRQAHASISIGAPCKVAGRERTVN